MFPVAQCGDSLFIRGVADQMKTAQSLDGSQKSVGQSLGQGGNGRIASGLSDSVTIRQPDRRTANRTGVGLGVEAPIRRIGIFGGAVRTQWETGH